MNSTDPQTTATLLALGLLSDAEARTVAASLTQSMPQRLQVAAVQDIATALLLSETPTPSAPPARVLEGVQKRIHRSDQRQRWTTRGLAALRWSGWVAAAAMAVLLAWPKAGDSSPPIASAASPHTARPERAVTGEAHATSGVGTRNDASLQREVQNLRAEVEHLRSQVAASGLAQNAAGSVSVMGFSRNGKAAPLNSILPSGSELATVVATALKPYLAGGTTLHQVGPEIVIESGFGAFTAATLPDGYYFRHRNFPADASESLGLLTSTDGSFYDPTGQLIWQPDATRPGSYLGYRPEADADLSRYGPSTPPSVAATPPRQAPNNTSASTSPVSSLPRPPDTQPVSAATSTPPIIAIIGDRTLGGPVIVPQLLNAQPPIPNSQPVLWSWQINPATGQPTFKKIGTSIPQVTANDIPSRGIFQVGASDMSLIQAGNPTGLTWETDPNASQPSTTPEGVTGP